MLNGCKPAQDNYVSASTLKHASVISPVNGGGVICEPSSDADGAQLTGGRSDDGVVGTICKTEHCDTVH